MQLGKTIVGAVIGAAIGILGMVAVYWVSSLVSVWLALGVAILTGLGVRLMVATSGHASYLRGAITGAMALGAYLLGTLVVASFAQYYAAKANAPRQIEAAAADKAGEDAGDAEASQPEEKAPEPPNAAAMRRLSGGMRKAPVATGLSTLEFIVLCVSALIAYELGRGTAPKTMALASDEPPPADVPQGAHPDA